MSAPTFRLIVGLGNPGREYRDTRHNVGFMVIDRMVSRELGEFRLEKSWESEIARCGDVIYCKPQTFMNLSGRAVRSLGSFHKIGPAETLIVLDDMALPLGKLRLRLAGSAGGHNGLSSVIDHFGTQEVPRLRIGIGAAPGADRAVSHVLGKFLPEEREPLEECLARSVSAIDRAQTEGFAAAMNAFN